MKFLARFGIVLPFFMPAFALAQFGGVNSFINAIIQFINGTLVPLVFAVAFLIFIWGIFKYFILGGHDENQRESGRGLMLWGIIGFVVMVSIWGLVNVLASGLGFRQEELIGIPNVPTNN